MYNVLHIKCPLFLFDFNETCNFSTDFRKILKYQNFIKIRPVGAELFHADRRTDMTKLIVAFRNFANANKKHPNFETIFAAFTTQWPSVTNEHVGNVIALIFSPILVPSQHSMLPKRLCQTSFQLA